MNWNRENGAKSSLQDEIKLLKLRERAKDDLDNGGRKSWRWRTMWEYDNLFNHPLAYN